MKNTLTIIALIFLATACSESAQFTGWQTEEFPETEISKSQMKSFILSNPSDDQEQRIRGIAFDRGSNAAGHFRIDKMTVGELEVEPTDIIIPPGSFLKVYVTYSPLNLKTDKAAYGGWVTGEEKRWMPKRAEEVGKDENNQVYHRAIIEAVYDFPREGIYYVQLVGEAVEGPDGETEAGGAFASCTPGGGTACYSGGFALDIPDLSPGGPKPLEMTGPIKMNISGGQASMQMDDFPFIIYYLRSEEIPKLPSGVSATLVLSGVPDAEATGTFDGTRLLLTDVAFRIRVALGILTIDQVKQGMSALVDFDVPGLEITTITPFEQGNITLHLETKLPQNPSGNELFDERLSGVKIIAIMEGELNF